jgi:uncharacterized membrane protein HdeD (DUF308 family)
VFLAIIGDAWLSATNLTSRRIDDPTDTVRIEIEAALQRQILLVPVLVGQAHIPRENDLPESLRPLAFRNAAEVRSGRDMNYHIESLIRGLQTHFAPSQTSPQPTTDMQKPEVVRRVPQRKEPKEAIQRQTEEERQQRTQTYERQPHVKEEQNESIQLQDTARKRYQSVSTNLDKLLFRYWWMLALRGMLALLFGILLFIWPGTLGGLITLFGAYALLAGAVSIIGAVSNQHSDEKWWLIFLLGLVNIVAGASIIRAIVTMALTTWELVTGANALVTGVLDITIAIRLRKGIQGEWLWMLVGIASVVLGGYLVFGTLFLPSPGVGMLALLRLTNVHAIVTGVLLLVLAFRVRVSGQEKVSEVVSP